MFNNFHKRKKKGQSTLEYAILIIIIIGALLSIQVYIKRGVQGRLKGAADDIGDQFSVGNTNVTTTITRISESNDTFSTGETSSVLTEIDTVTTKVNSAIMDQTLEYWGN